MKKPTMQELTEYAEKIGFKGFDAEQFLAHYNSNGWRVGRVKMVSWQSAVVTWKKNAAKFGRPQVRQEPRMTYRHRENKINYLNRRKAELMRQRRTPEVDRELAAIQIELHKL